MMILCRRGKKPGRYALLQLKISSHNVSSFVRGRSGHHRLLPVSRAHQRYVRQPMRQPMRQPSLQPRAAFANTAPVWLCDWL